MNQFQTQIVKMVREMPDDALLDLVRAELSRGGGLDIARAVAGGVTTAAAASLVGALARPRKAAPRRRPAPKRKRKAVAFTPATVEKVFHAVRMARRGVSIGDIEGYTKLSREHVRRALKELVGGKKLARAGKLRFTRYATTKAAAQKASKAR